MEVPLDKKGKELVGVNIVHLTPINRNRIDPMFLATTLPIGIREELSRVVILYSWRWTIVANWKQALGASAFRVFSCWEAIDRLLAMAHMAFLVLYLLYALGQEAARGAMAAMWRRAGELLRQYVARPPELTLGQFFDMLALDCTPGLCLRMARSSLTLPAPEKIRRAADTVVGRVMAHPHR